MASRPSADIYTETLAVFEGKEGEPLTTPEVADALEENRRAVYQRLSNLVDRGELETKETGANSRVWWRPHDSTGPESLHQGGQKVTTIERGNVAENTCDTSSTRLLTASSSTMQRERSWTQTRRSRTCLATPGMRFSR